MSGRDLAGRARRARRLAAMAVVGALVWARAADAFAATKIELLVIGNNQPPALAGAGAETAPPSLRFADDDAAAFFEFMAPIADAGQLLTVMDADTQAAYPQLAAIARPPSLAELRAALAALAIRIERNRAGGHRSVLFLFFSGHGVVGEGGEPALSLLDGGITRELLYDEILARLSADYVHVLVDACNAEAVVRPRNADARVVTVGRDEAAAFLAGSTLARFPHVGAIVASSEDAPAHEWDLLQHGVFTQELLSALRGAADVNHDGRVEYSEVYAFLKAANRGVDDPRVRLTVVARPPSIDRRVPLVDLSLFAPAGNARLTGVPGRAGVVELEDGRGRRLASVHGEQDYDADLVLPAGRTVYVRAHDREARFESVAGGTIRFGDLRFAAPGERPRGALEGALRRGLFAAEFGRGYYCGVVDEAGLASVSFASRPPEPAVAAAAAGRPATRNRWLVAVGASTAVAEELDGTLGIRLGRRPVDAAGVIASADLTRAARAGLGEWRMTASAGWSRGVRRERFSAWAGLAAGGGVIGQTSPGEPSRWSGLAVAGPVAGLGAVVARGVEVSLEAELFASLYRRDGRDVMAAAPGVWLGVSLAR
jgi:hypothetical protein